MLLNNYLTNAQAIPIVFTVNVFGFMSKLFVLRLNESKLIPLRLLCSFPHNDRQFHIQVYCGKMQNRSL